MAKKRFDILIDLINKNKFTKIAEVGVSRGFTAREVIAKCKQLERYYMIDPDPNEVFEYENVFRGYKHALFLRLKSIQAVKCIEDEELDLVFIDADHGYENVTEDIKLWLPKVRKGGILYGHDYNEYNKGVIRAVNEIFLEPHLEEDELDYPPKEGDKSYVWWVSVVDRVNSRSSS